MGDYESRHGCRTPKIVLVPKILVLTIDDVLCRRSDAICYACSCQHITGDGMDTQFQLDMPGGAESYCPPTPSSLARFLPVSQYLLEFASGVWVLECGVLTSLGARQAYRIHV